MSRPAPRWQVRDQLSRIKANLNDMRQSVSKYLQKNSKHYVPPILKPKHYLILNCLHDSVHQSEQEITPVNTDNHRPSSRLKNKLESINHEQFQSLRKINMITRYPPQQRKENDKDSQITLPPICNLQLECKTGKSRENHLINRRLQQLRNRKHEQIEQDEGKNKVRYHTIELSRVSMQDTSSEFSPGLRPRLSSFLIQKFRPSNSSIDNDKMSQSVSLNGTIHASDSKHSLPRHNPQRELDRVQSSKRVKLKSEVPKPSKFQMFSGSPPKANEPTKLPLSPKSPNKRKPSLTIDSSQCAPWETQKMDEFQNQLL